MKNLIGLKELREKFDTYIAEMQKGKSFIVIRRSKPVFRISPPNEEEMWEQIIDFTKIKKGGVELNKLLFRL